MCPVPMLSEAEALAFEVEALARDAERARGGVHLAVVIAQRERIISRLDARERRARACRRAATAM